MFESIETERESWKRQFWIFFKLNVYTLIQNIVLK